MSRIPVPTNSYSRTANRGSPSPIPFPERATTPPNRPPPSAATMSTLSGSMAETRKKQTKRDEAIRKKIESELARKRTISTPQRDARPRRTNKSSAQKGTVAALKPSPALTVPENITVAEASQLCAAKRTDCVLVVDDEEGLSGIFTAKDLAYRVTAEGLDPHATPVSSIMTRGPMVTRDTTSATEALQLMVTRHFRHLPVCNEEGNVVGLLDITKVFHEALDKVERSSSASERLYNALAGVQNELGSGMGSNPQTAAMLSYVEALREKTAMPDLTSVMDSRTQPAVVGPKTTVREVAKLMRERRTTAVCVMETSTPPPGGIASPPRIVGIFTSKDIVLRVIAAGLDASRCSVVRVMTPHPDIVPPDMTVHNALKMMHDGHYLNLPVVEADGRLVAIVDVLKLTYATLEQMNTMALENPADADTEGGPMWSRFFESLAEEGSESVFSGSVDSHSRRLSRSVSHLLQSPYSEVHPNDSASVVDDEPLSALEGYGRPKADVASSIQGTTPPPPPVDDGTYVFKVRAPSGRAHRFQARHNSVENLRDIIAGKLATDPFFTQYKAKDEFEEPPDPSDFLMSYTDADGDVVLISSDNDVSDAVKIAREGGADRVVVHIQGGRGWKDEEEKSQVVETQKEVKEEVEKPVEKTEEVASLPPVIHVPHHTIHYPTNLDIEDNIFGVPKDLLLPASIGALAAVILGVFTISRLARY